MEANGSNNLVESKRGKKYATIKMEDILRDMQKSNSETMNLQDALIFDQEDRQEDLDFEEEQL